MSVILTVVGATVLSVGGLCLALVLDQFRRCFAADRRLKGLAAFQKMEGGRLVYVAYWGCKGEALAVARQAEEDLGVNIRVK